MSPPPIPLAYRIMFNYIEPLFATGGALQAVLAPATLLRLSLPSVPYTPSWYPLFPQQAGAWLMLAFHDAVTLRVYRSDVRVWRLVLGAALLSDVGYVAGLVLSMGAGLFFNPLRWDAATAMTVVTTVVPLGFKVAFQLGVGLPKTQGEKEA